MRNLKQTGLLAALALLSATPVLADPQAADAPVAQPQAAAAQTDDTDAQIAAWTNGLGQQGQPQNDGPAPPRQIHGEAGVGFGNRGYREGYVYADIPIGQNSDLGVGVDDTQFRTPGGRNVNSKSLSLSLFIDTSKDRGPGGCRAAAVPMDGRYLEPMWVAQAHGEALARDQADCEVAQSTGVSTSAPPPAGGPMRTAE